MPIVGDEELLDFKEHLNKIGLFQCIFIGKYQKISGASRISHDCQEYIQVSYQ